MKLLIVVDMQKDFIDGALGSREAKAIVGNVKEKIEAYQAAGEDVIFTLDTHGENYMETQEGKNLPVPHCIKGTEGWELDAELKEFQGKRFEKKTFGSTALMEYVQEREYESVELVGVCTDICVISNALLVKAALPEVPVLVDSACCAGVTPESHENALNAMKMCHIAVQ